MAVVFSGLAPLVIDGVVREEGLVRVRAHTPPEPVACPGCGGVTVRVHGYHLRHVVDLSIEGVPGGG